MIKIERKGEKKVMNDVRSGRSRSDGDNGGVMEKEKSGIHEGREK